MNIFAYGAVAGRFSEVVEPKSGVYRPDVRFFLPWTFAVLIHLAGVLAVGSEQMGDVHMALWKRPDHAYFARVILGLIAGIPEDELQRLAWSGPVDRIIKAASEHQK